MVGQHRTEEHHPNLGAERSLVIWDGYHGGVDFETLDRRVVRTVAKPLVHASVDGAWVARAAAGGFGVVMPGEAWRNQLVEGHPKRAGAFSRLPYALERTLDIAAAPLSPGFIEEYAGHYLDAALSAGATLATTPAHVHTIESGIGRENDLALAEAVSSDFLARRAHHPANESSLPRTLFATIVVQGPHLARALPALCDSYASLRVGGYWIVVVNCRQTLRQTDAVTDLALTLQEWTGRPTTVSCVGAAHLALLGHGVSSTCIGHHGGTLGFPPEDWAKRKREQATAAGRDDTGIGVHTFHREALANIRLGAKGRVQRQELFRRWPCSCGAHRPRVPPSPDQVRSHNLRCTVSDALELCLLPEDEALTYTAHRIELAQKVRGAINMPALRPAWRGPAQALERCKQRRMNNASVAS